MNPSNNKESHRIINDYFTMLHAEQDVSGIVGEVVKNIFEDEDLHNREYHLGSLLNSNVINASVDYVRNLIQAVLEIDNFSSKQISLEPKKSQNIVTVAGSGKKGVKTINISTPATIVAASCGAQIVKPCSRSTSSLTGSSDFFTYVGGEFKNTEETCRDFYKTNIGFFSIEGLIPKFDSIYGGKALTPTALSYALPAVINPIKTNSILYGLSLPNIKTSIHSLHELGYDNVIVANTSNDNKKFVDEIGLFRYNNLVHGRNSEDYDEVIVGDPVKMLKLKSRYAIDSILQKESITQNIKASVDVLKGKGEDVHKEIIAVNAGSIMYLANLADNLREGYLLALKEIYTGRPFDKLQEIVTTSGGTLSNV